MGNRTHRIGWAGNLFSRSEGNSNFAYLTIAAAVAVGGMGAFEAIGDSSGKLITEQVHSDAVAAAGVDDMPAGDGNHGVTLGGSFAAAGGEPDPALCEELHLTGTGCDAYLSGEGIDCENTEAGYQSQCIGFLAGGGSVMGEPDAENENIDPEEYAELLERIEELEDENCSGTFGCLGKGLGDDWGRFTGFVGSKWNSFTGWASDTMASAVSLASSAWGGLTNWITVTAPNWVSNKWNDFTGWTSEQWGNFKSYMANEWQQFKDGMKALGEFAIDAVFTVGAVLVGAGYGIYQLGKWAVTGLWDLGVDAWNGGYHWVTETAPAWIDEQQTRIEENWNDFKAGVADKWSSFTGWVDNTWDTGYAATHHWVTETAPAWIDEQQTRVEENWNDFKAGVADKWNGFTSWTSDKWNGFTGWVDNTWDTGYEAVSEHVVEPTVERVQEEVEQAQDRVENATDGVLTGYREANDAADISDHVQDALGDSITVEIVDLADGFHGDDADAADIRIATSKWAQDLSDSQIENAIEDLQEIANDDDQHADTVEFAEIMIDALDARLNPPEPVQYQGGVPQ